MTKKRELIDNDSETREGFNLPNLPILHDNAIGIEPENPRLATMLQTVRDYITQNEWNCEETPRDDGGVLFATYFNLENGNLRVAIKVLGDGNHCRIYAYAPFYIKEEYRAAVAVFTTYINYQTTVTKLEMDMEDGELRMSCSVNVAGSFLSREMFEFMEYGVIALMNRCLGLVMSMMYGGISPKQAFERYMKGNNNNSNTDSTESGSVVLH